MTEAHIREVFDGGNARLKLGEAVKKLQTVAKIGRTLAYESLLLEQGEFSHLLHEREDKTVGLVDLGAAA